MQDQRTLEMYKLQALAPKRVEIHWHKSQSKNIVETPNMVEFDEMTKGYTMSNDLFAQVVRLAL
jgi:hypothetical protein